MILEPNDSSLTVPDGSKILYDGCVAASKVLEACHPDTIILITPHGISLKEALSIYMNNTVSGSAEWNGYGSNYEVKCSCDTALGAELLEYLTINNVRAEGITSFAQSCSAPIAWGEVVPLWFNRSILSSSTKIVILALPQLRFDPLGYATQADILGYHLFSFCHTHNKRIALMFSCDLSHVHSIPANVNSKYHCIPSLGENSQLASEFDGYVVKWANELLLKRDCVVSRAIVENELASRVVEAKACGWTGICCIQRCVESLLDSVSTSSTLSPQFNGHLFAYEHPSYYGMLVASLSPINTQ